MSKTVIRVENLGKKYIISHQQENAQYTALRDVITNGAKGLAARFQKKKDQRTDLVSEEFWALKDISFDIKQGDRVGIIGRNGAGKSTLLKVLSRITEPTTGKIKLNGRVASLLEVGTGFHPELTGRENVYLNGAILGMGKSEIRRKFDEIISFAEVEKFIDTPVKRYSSGMYVRLAFAVAAHLEPEILIVDEVLAVGDAKFQQKCLGKMRDVSAEGRTIMFVSHNNSAISTLCNRGIVMDSGSLVIDSNVRDAISFYCNQVNDSKFTAEANEDKPTITSVVVSQDLLERGHLEVSVAFSSPWKLDPPLVGIVVHTMLGVPVLGSNTWFDPSFSAFSTNEGIAKMRVENLPLHSGNYKLSVWLGEKNQNYDSQLDVLQFEYVSSTTLPQHLSTETIGVLNIPTCWDLEARKEILV